MQFPDRLAAKVALQRYFFETIKNDNITLSWSTKSFDFIMFMSYLLIKVDKYLSNIDSQIDFDQEFLELLGAIVGFKSIESKLHEERVDIFSKEGVYFISNMFNKTVQYIEPVAEKFGLFSV